MTKRILSLVMCILTVFSMFSVLTVSAGATENYLWPVPGSKEITQSFSSYHNGIDITLGDKIVSTKSGKVIMVYSGCKNYNSADTMTDCTEESCNPNCGFWTSPRYEVTTCNWGLGNAVVVRNHDGSYATYGHLATVSVKLGDNIKQGDKIGTMGSTGCSTGLHLHFSLSEGGAMSGTYFKMTDYIDPETVRYVNIANPGKYILDDGYIYVTVNNTKVTDEYDWESIGDYDYDGNVKSPTITVKASSGKTLKEDESYEIETCCGGEHTEIGEHYFIIYGTGNYEGCVAKTFNITKKTVENCTVTLSPLAYSYDGKTKKPTVTVTNPKGTTLTEGRSYELEYCCCNGCKSIGTHYVTVYGTGNYEGWVTEEFYIAGTPEALSTCNVALDKKTFTYNGTVKTPSLTVTNADGETVREGVGYSVSYCCKGGCKTVGTHTVTVTGSVFYKGTVKKTFTITKQPLESSNISLSSTAFTYNNQIKKPTVTVKSSQGSTLTKDASYTVKYCCSGTCRTVGTHTVTITGMGNYTGTVKKTFKIEKQPLVGGRITLSTTSCTYNNSVKKIGVTVKSAQGTTLTKDSSYTVKYCCKGGCKNPGQHTITLTGIGNYTGTVKKTFTIKKQAVIKARTTLSCTSYKYNGKAKAPTVTVKTIQGTTLTKNTSYTVKYCCAGGCKKVGTHTVTVTGIGNYMGIAKKTFTIKK